MGESKIVPAEEDTAGGTALRPKIPVKGPLEEYFLWGYYGTQYRVRFYPPFGV